jgi:hypothetical protein
MLIKKKKERTCICCACGGPLYQVSLHPNLLKFTTQDGLHGCGQQTAAAVVRYHTGGDLCAAFLVQDALHFDKLLSTWRAEMCDILRADPQGFIGHHCGVLATHITSTFPNTMVLQQYLCPQTSVSANQGKLVLNEMFTDVPALSKLCEEYFGWATDLSLLKRFRSLIWPGVVLQLLIEKLVATDNAQQQYMEVSFIHHAQVCIVKKVLHCYSHQQHLLTFISLMTCQSMCCLEADYKTSQSGWCNSLQRSLKLRLSPRLPELLTQEY